MLSSKVMAGTGGYENVQNYFWMEQMVDNLPVLILQNVSQQMS